MADTLENLNKSQLAAVTSTEGFIRVIAGAGSGKTRALTRRFAYLVNDMGILPGNVLCVTFTNKAANEMQRRIQNLTGDSSTGYINTFHGFCVGVLQEDSFAVSYPKSFLVLDNSDIDAMLSIVYEERGLTLRDKPFSKARDMVEMQKLKYKPDYYLDLIRMDLASLRQKFDAAQETDDVIFFGYLYQQKKCFGLDYNDLIKFTLYIFDQYPELKLKWQKRLEYVMIDEFQDIDDLQYELMDVLCGYHKNLFVVGDPDQTIYTWRGANVKFLLDLDKHFAGMKTVMMMENYRSTPEILAAANSLIDKNAHRMKKELLPMLPHGESVLVHHARSAREEAKWIADEIAKLRESGVSLSDITVLYRAHYFTRPVEEVFIERKLPYAIYSGVQFFDRTEIKTALSYLRMAAVGDDLAFRRTVNTPRRNIGVSRMKLLEEYASEHGCTLFSALMALADDERFRGTKARAFIDLIARFSAERNGAAVSELLSDILEASGYEELLRTEGSQERLDNLAELKQSVYEYETTCGEEATLEHYLSHIALFTNSDAIDAKDKVKLMTVHAAKGLEFPYVFLCGMNEGVFPSRKVRTLASMEEERRLAFVAMTRAEKRLFISEAEGFGHDGTPRYPSRFILDIDDRLLEHTKKPDEGLIKAARAHVAASERLMPDPDGAEHFEEGARVGHPILGNGTVIGTDLEKTAYVIQFDELPTPRSITFRAKLVRI